MRVNKELTVDLRISRNSLLGRMLTKGNRLAEGVLRRMEFRDTRLLVRRDGFGVSGHRFAGIPRGTRLPGGALL